MDSSEWNSPMLHTLSAACGWCCFVVWSLSSYPQAVLNYRRKSVVGLSFDFVLINFTKHTTYLAYNAFFTLSSGMRTQYRQKYGENAIIPVTLSDLAFSTHSVLLVLVKVYQCVYYDRGGQRISRVGARVTAAAWATVLGLVVYAGPSGRWLVLAGGLGLVQDGLTFLKYLPQLALNCRRRSTEGWSIANVLMDFTGGALVFLQLVLQSVDSGNLDNLRGGYGKLCLSLITLVFDLIFILQHFVLYRQKPSSITKLDVQV